ncbi:MAG: Dna2/Cas4 domain-containing protein, partial [Bacteroidota bacterium]
LDLFALGYQCGGMLHVEAIGKEIEEYSYQDRADRWQQIELEGIKIDHYDAQAGIVREVKKSNKKESVHIAQLKYYLFVLERNGISVQKGVLEYPTIRLTEEVFLTAKDRTAIPLDEERAKEIIARESCPPLVEKSICRKCSYYEFCYIE